MTRNKVLVVLLLVCLTTASLTVLAQDKNDKKNAPAAAAPAMPVVAIPAAKEAVKETVSAVGSLLASESAEIRSEIVGKVDKINFTEGGEVKKGDVLVEIDNSLIRTELSKAQAAYRVASSTLSRDKQLRDSKYISAQEFDQSGSTVQQQKADVDSAKIRLERTYIKAPFDGVAGLRNFSVGDYIDLTRILTTIDAYDPIKIEFSIPERNFSDLRIGQKITFKTDAWKDETFEGEIYALDSRIDPKTRSVNVKAQAANSDNKLRGGMFARIEIETAIKEGVILIPEEAITPSSKSDSVYVVEQNKAVSRNVKLGLRQKGKVEVTEGLQEGELIIIAGSQRIRPGMDVKVTEEKQDAQPSAR